MKIIAARYVLPISAEPIENGAVAIENDKIISVGTIEEISEKFPENKNRKFRRSGNFARLCQCSFASRNHGDARLSR